METAGRRDGCLDAYSMMVMLLVEGGGEMQLTPRALQYEHGRLPSH